MTLLNHIGRFVLGLLYVGGEVRLGWSGVRVAGLSTCLSLLPGHCSSLTTPHLQNTADRERRDRCGKQHRSRELLTMGIIMLETC